MATTLPGSFGLPILGETPSLLLDLQTFITTRIRTHGPLFRTHLLRLPTLISCTYTTSLQILHPSQTETLSASAAYAEFMSAIYPTPTQNLILSPTISPARTIAARHFLPALSPALLPGYIHPLTSIIDTHFSSISTTIQPYTIFKPLTRALTTHLLLGPLPASTVATLHKHLSTHFNAILATPISLSLPGLQTARARANIAYTSLTSLLTNLISTRLASPNPPETSLLDNILSTLPAPPPAQITAHLAQFLLLLLSPAVPKSLASALSSFLHELSDPSSATLLSKLRITQPENNPALDKALMEVLRLHPPLLGGIRLQQPATPSTTIAGHALQGAWRVWYSIRHSNRDADVYHAPEQFRPERWASSVAPGVGTCPFAKPGEERPGACPTPLSFGAGERHCPGRDVAWALLTTVVNRFLERFDVVPADAKVEREVRFLPVLRQVCEGEVRLMVREETSVAVEM